MGCILGNENASKSQIKENKIIRLNNLIIFLAL